MLAVSDQSVEEVKRLIAEGANLNANPPLVRNYLLFAVQL